jgi:hypothetical protein
MRVMLRSRAYVAVVLAAALIAPASAPALPIEYLPVRHAAYDEIETLAAEGLLDSLNIYTRPLARVDVAAALLRARRRHATITSNPNYQRLERELARELTDLGAPPERPESRLLVDTGPGTQRGRLSIATHLRGDYDPDREGAEARLRDESSLTARGSIQLSPVFGAYEELGVTRIRSQREFIDAIAAHSDLEMAVMRAEITARTGPIGIAAGYEQFRWGPGRRGTLLLSDAAGPITFFQYGGSFGGRVTATAFSGVLSKADGRYMAAHRLEALVTPRLSIGITEGVRYSGTGIDPLYAIGLLPYTIVERIHERDASNDSIRYLQRSNVMASLDAVARVSPALSLYGEFLIDDLATEDKSMPDRLGYQAGLRSDRPFGAHTAHILAEYTRVRRFTYATYYDEDFIHRNHPIGFVLGPDVETVWMEVGFDLSRNWQAKWSGEFTNQGEGYLGEYWTPSMGPVSNAGLYGVVQERREFWGDLRWMPRDQFDLSVGLGYRRIANLLHVEGDTQTGWLARMALEARY